MYRMLFFLLFYSLGAFCQVPSDLRSEQVFVRIANNVCTAGDTIGVEGIVTCLARDRVKPYSKYVYVEFINDSDSVTSRQKVACEENGCFSTKIPSDPFVSSGVCYIRAYTNLMRNFSESSFAVQPLLVNREFPKHSHVAIEDVRCKIVPSGNTLVAGGSVLQSAIVYVTDAFGYPLPKMHLNLLNQSGDTIYSTRTSLSGIASVWLVPQKDEKYSLGCNIGNESKTFPMPVVSAEEYKLLGKISNKVLTYEVLGRHSGIEAYRLYLYDRENGIYNVHDLKCGGKIKLDGNPQNVTMFLVDATGSVVAETTVLSDSMEVAQLVCGDSIKVDSKINFELKNLGCTPSKVLVRLEPYTNPWLSHAESALYYESEFSSPIPFPQYYFEESNRERFSDLQAWLSTARFKRFNLKNVLSNSGDVYRFMPETVMSFSGFVENEMKRPMKGGTLVAYNMSNDFVYDAPIDSLGRFTIGVDDFEDGTKFFLQPTNAKDKPVDATIRVDDSHFPPVEIPYRYDSGGSSYYVAGTDVEFGSTKYRHQLPDVIVKARLQKEKAKPTNKFYSVNYFDHEKIVKHSYPTLLDIIKAMPGVRVIEGGDGNPTDEGDAGELVEYMIVSKRGFSTLRPKGMPIIMDGCRLTGEMQMTALRTPGIEIEEVELLRPWQTIMYAPGCIDGAILVKSKDAVPKVTVKSKGTIYAPIGLSGSSSIKQNSLYANEVGMYRLLVDVVSDDGVRSFEKVIKVVDK